MPGTARRAHPDRGVTVTTLNEAQLHLRAPPLDREAVLVSRTIKVPETDMAIGEEKLALVTRFAAGVQAVDNVPPKPVHRHGNQTVVGATSRSQGPSRGLVTGSVAPETSPSSAPADDVPADRRGGCQHVLPLPFRRSRGRPHAGQPPHADQTLSAAVPGPFRHIHAHTTHRRSVAAGQSTAT